MLANLENSAVATRLEKVSFHFQSQRKAMPKNVQITIQLHSFHMLARLCSKSFKLGFSSRWTENFQIHKLDSEKAEEPEIKLPISMICWITEKARELKKKNLLLLHDYAKTFDCVDHNKLWKILKRDGHTWSPYLPPEKPVCRTRSNSYHWTWNNGLLQNW